MGKKKNGFRRLLQRMKLKKWTAMFCVAMLLSGCAAMPPQNEMEARRETQAKEDLKTLEPPASINFEKPLTLEDAIKIGLCNNLELRVADFNREVANKETLVQKLRMLPGLNAEAGYERRDKLRKSDVYNWKLEKDVEDYTVSELKDGAKANLSLTWNILDTALAYVRSGQAKMQEAALEKRRHRMAQFVALDITEAYWQAAAVEDALDYVHEVDKRMKAVKANIDGAVKDRLLDAMDAAEAEMRLKELELTIRRLQADLSKARLKLSQLMGINQNVQYTLYRPPIKPVVAALPHPKELDIDRLEEFALTHRPDLFETDINVMIQKQDAKSAFLKLFPGVSLFARTSYDSNRLLLSNTWNTVGAGIGWNLLDLPARIADLKRSGKTVDMAEAQRLMLTVGVITQVHIAMLDYAIKVDRFRLLEDTYTLSADLLDMSKEKMSVGKLKQLDVTQRQLEEMASKLRRDESVVDMIVAHKRLCVTVGIDPLDCDGSFMGGRSGAMADTTPLKRWKCTECGYIHTGPTPPEVCPICGADRGKFVEYSGADDVESLSKWGKNAGEPVIAPSSSSRGTVSPLSPSPASDRFASAASDQFLWKVQVGAFSHEGGAAKRIAQLKDADLRLGDARDADIETATVNGKTVNRVRFKGLTQTDARNMASELKRRGMEYWLLPPHSAHW